VPCTPTCDPSCTYGCDTIGNCNPPPCDDTCYSCGTTTACGTYCGDCPTSSNDCSDGSTCEDGYCADGSTCGVNSITK
jgi:hypothetical protein